MNQLALKNWGIDVRKYSIKQRFIAVGLGLGLGALVFFTTAFIDVLRFYEVTHNKAALGFNPYNFLAASLLTVSFFAWTGTFIVLKKDKGNLYFVTVTMGLFFFSMVSLLIDLLAQIGLGRYYSQVMDLKFDAYISSVIIQYHNKYIVLLAIIITSIVIQFRLKAYRLNVQRDTGDTSKKLGSAEFANTHELTHYGLRQESGTLLGKDSKGYLRTKLTDRLILAYRGGGKSSSLLIPLIIDEINTNKLITDIKGELAAITAKRAIEAGRQVYIIDPFDVLKSLNVDLKTHKFNPLAQINTCDPLIRDRSISAIAAALNTSSAGNKSETDNHFSENAQVILEGIIDYYLDQSEEGDCVSLPALHDWWVEQMKDKENKGLAALNTGSSKAKAAYSVIFAAGENEAGSMKTTVYRQFQWLRSENMRQTFCDDEIDLADFVEGACDIYVVLPEDMVKAHSRMVRLVMGMVKAKIVSTQIDKLKSDYCFVLDELGQFGYCQDVEQVIATLRGRGVKVWASFQTYGQIKQYPDKATFTGMPIKHIFESDDLETLEWLQKLAGKTTVLSENVSKNIGQNAKQVMKSGSESYSVSEQSTELLKINTIREMPYNEQLLFIRGMKLIKCEKAFYFKESVYQGKYDKNPIEERAK